MKLKNNLFSYKNILIAVKGKDIKGILIGYDIADVNKREMNKDLANALSFFARLRFWIIISCSRHIMDFQGINGYYIQNLCVDPASRGKGIGRKLLDYYIAVSKNGAQNVYLDVEANNEGAVKLYRAMDFEIFRTTDIKIAGVTLYRMRRTADML